MASEISPISPTFCSPVPEKAALSCGLPVLRHHLTPKPRGTYLTLCEMRNKIDAVYSITVVYAGCYDGNKRVNIPELIGK